MKRLFFFPPSVNRDTDLWRRAREGRAAAGVFYDHTVREDSRCLDYHAEWKGCTHG